MALPGSLYLYQGEELGLHEVYDLPLDVLDDPTWERSGHTKKGRDGSRVPIPWTLDGSSCGFGSEGSWLPQPDDWGTLSVEAQRDVQGSTLELYKGAIELRRRLLQGEPFEWRRWSSDVIAFSRGPVVCAVNLGDSPVSLPPGEVILASGRLHDGLPPDTAVWMKNEG
jgi:alpha-glucosidase